MLALLSPSIPIIQFLLILLSVLILYESMFVAGNIYQTIVAESFNFAAVGDWNSGDETTRTAENIDSRNVEVVIGLGDYAYEQELDDIRSWWKSIKIIYDNEIFLGALGNHDSDSDGDENGIEDEDVYLELFKQNSNQSSWTYSFVYGSVLFILINTEDGTDKQRDKVIDILKRSNAYWKVVFLHKPILTSETTHGVEEDEFNEEEYCQVFENYDANLVLQAHNHNYQRSYVLDCNNNNDFVKSEDGEGFTIVNVGTGGARLYEFQGKSPLMVKQFDDRFGFLNVNVVNETEMDAQFISNNGASIEDSFVISKNKLLCTIV